MPPWLLATVLPWLKDHWRDACVVLMVLFAALWVRQGGKLAACQQALAAKPEAAISQFQATSGTAAATVKTVYKYVQGQPCPDVEVTSSTEAKFVAVQAQTMTPQVSAAEWQRRLDIYVGSDIELNTVGGFRLDVTKLGPVVMGLGVESPIDHVAVKGLVSFGFVLP